jgi:DNA invertase Pin-like site-specific DNA recombinase
LEVVVMTTKAGVWVRVSSGSQDEANQVPDVERYVLDHGYDETRRYTVRDRSAYHGEQQAELDKMLTDMRHGLIEVLVCWHSDRLERRGHEALFALLKDVHDAGGRVESVKEPQLGQTDTSGAVLTFMSGLMSHQESLHKSERITLARDRAKTNGALWGRANWGYEVSGDKYTKTLAPTPDGERYVPEVFQRIADGQTCKQVAAWLGAEIRPGVSHKTILRMIRNPVYRGVRVDGSGRPETKVPALVSATLWRAANNRLSNGNRGKRTPAKGQPALLTSVLFCARCRKGPLGNAAPMYRIHPPGRGYWYRCHGFEPDNKGCGNIVHLETTDAKVTALLSKAPGPHSELQWVPGANFDNELVEIALALNDLPMRGLSDDDEDAERKRLRAGRDRLELLNQDAEPDRWEQVPTGETIGEHWASLDLTGQRKMLLADVKVYANDAMVYDADGELVRQPVVTIESRLFAVASDLYGMEGESPPAGGGQGVGNVLGNASTSGGAGGSAAVRDGDGGGLRRVQLHGWPGHPGARG